MTIHLSQTVIISGIFYSFKNRLESSTRSHKLVFLHCHWIRVKSGFPHCPRSCWSLHETHLNIGAEEGYSDDTTLLIHDTHDNHSWKHSQCCSFDRTDPPLDNNNTMISLLKTPIFRIAERHSTMRMTEENRTRLTEDCAKYSNKTPIFRRTNSLSGRYDGIATVNWKPLLTLHHIGPGCLPTNDKSAFLCATDTSIRDAVRCVRRHNHYTFSPGPSDQ